MKKIPTIFERDWEGDRSRVLDVPAAGCEWVFAGEGIARRKYDGTAVLIEDQLMYKRHEVRAGKERPEGFWEVDDDLETGKTVGWVLVGGGPEDKWHREAHEFIFELGLPNGTYELCGPKIQGNPESYDEHVLVPHSSTEEILLPERSYTAIQKVFEENDIEGIVFHHRDGRMAKIKARDYGIKRARPA